MLKNQLYKQGFEVEDIRTRKNYSFVYDPFSQAVLGYDTSINQYPRNVKMFRYTKDFPHDHKSAYEYFLYLYNKSLTFENDDNVHFLGWINPCNFQPLEIEEDEEGNIIAENKP